MHIFLKSECPFYCRHDALLDVALRAVRDRPLPGGHPFRGHRQDPPVPGRLLPGRLPGRLVEATGRPSPSQDSRSALPLFRPVPFDIHSLC